MIVRPSEIPHSEFYNLLINSVVPRPIAWVSTISAEGQPNLAPFSFFNAVCAKPPLLAFATALRPPKDPESIRGEPKDTLQNIREIKEFVVNTVAYELAEAMNLTSGEYDGSINEFELAKVAAEPSTLVRPPRVAESPVSFECKLHTIVDFSPTPTSSSLIIGEIVCIHVRDEHLKNGKLDRNSLDLIGRMGGLQYTRTTQRFEMIRPKVGK
jgi:flavin reductase (DIM6/NTAB) family NADH-FMN oxidoreductase RutF